MVTKQHYEVYIYSELEKIFMGTFGTLAAAKEMTDAIIFNGNNLEITLDKIIITRVPSKKEKEPSTIISQDHVHALLSLSESD